MRVCVLVLKNKEMPNIVMLINGQPLVCEPQVTGVCALVLMKCQPAG